MRREDQALFYCSRPRRDLFDHARKRPGMGVADRSIPVDECAGLGRGRIQRLGQGDLFALLSCGKQFLCLPLQTRLAVAHVEERGRLAGRKAQRVGEIRKAALTRTEAGVDNLEGHSFLEQAGQIRLDLGQSRGRPVGLQRLELILRPALT